MNRFQNTAADHLRKYMPDELIPLFDALLDDIQPKTGGNVLDLVDKIHQAEDVFMCPGNDWDYLGPTYVANEGHGATLAGIQAEKVNPIKCGIGHPPNAIGLTTRSRNEELHRWGEWARELLKTPTNEILDNETARRKITEIIKVVTRMKGDQP